MPRELRVLLVDDSVTSRQLLSHFINRTSDMQVIGEAHDGHEAVEMVGNLRPDVVVMDINMPRMDGLEATREIMITMPTPIVIISANIEGKETEVAFQALRLGALTVLNKPVLPQNASEQARMDHLINTVRMMADVRVIHHRRIEEIPVSRNGVKLAEASGEIEVVAIVSSTGGPAALSEIVKGLPADYPLPVIVVQHMAADFLPSMISWLDSIAPLHVTFAEEGQMPQPGKLHIAPGNAHLVMSKGRRFAFDNVRGGAHIPSGDVLFESMAGSYGSQAIGVILTGMGGDGARGLRMMYDAGAITIAQDEESCVVFGMPKEAINLGAVRHVLSLADISKTLVRLAKDRKK